MGNSDKTSLNVNFDISGHNKRNHLNVMWGDNNDVNGKSDENITEFARE